MERAKQWLRPLGEVELHPTTGPNTAGEIASLAIAGGATRVASFGGDGTLNEVANGMIGSAIPLLTLPGGTANCLCIETGLGANPEKAAARLTGESEDVRIAAGKISGPGRQPRHFLLMAGAGMDAIVAEQVSKPLKARLGKLAYWAAGFAMFARSLPQITATVNGRQSTRGFVLMSRIRNYGGDLELAKSVSLVDNCFETLQFDGRLSLRFLPYLAAAGVGQVAKVPGVTVAPALIVECASADGERVPVQIDGELAGELPARFEIVPDALTLRLPKAYIARAKAKPWTMSPTP